MLCWYAASSFYLSPLIVNNVVQRCTVQRSCMKNSRMNLQAYVPPSLTSSSSHSSPSHSASQSSTSSHSLRRVQNKYAASNSIVDTHYSDLDENVQRELIVAINSLVTDGHYIDTIALREYDPYQDDNEGTDHELAVELMAHLSYVGKGVSKEQEIIDLLTTYVPPCVQKIDEHLNGDTELEAESIDFPLSPPPPDIDTPAHKIEKKQAIITLVNDITHLSKQRKDKLTELLIKYMDRFSLKGENLRQTDACMHEIDTGDAKPFRERLRSYSPPVQAIIDKEIQKMLDQKVIVASKSPYASNLLLVRKPDPTAEGGIKDRVCASFVRLNKDTVKDSYPLPILQRIFDRIGSSKWFTTMDLLSGFWQVMIKPEHRHKTAFITSRGLFEFLVMPFGLCNAPATFQRLIDNVIERL